MSLSSTTEQLHLEEPNQEDDTGPAGLSPTDHGKEAYLVLLGCCILQMPIWSLTMTYGIFLNYYTAALHFSGDSSSTGIIGTTSNAVIYLSMPILFGLFTNHWARWRRTSAIGGLLLLSGSLILSSFSTAIWHLVLTQGVLSALGSSLIYSPTTLYLNEWFVRRKGFALGASFSAKNIVGVGPPFIVSALLSSVGFRTTLRIWAGVVLCFGVPGIYLMRPRLSESVMSARHGRRLSWKFLRHPTFWVFQSSTIVFSSGYGLPQTYLPTFANKIVHLPTTTSSLMLALFNAPGILASVGFGTLCDGFRFWGGHTMSVFAVTCMSALGSALPVFVLWGLTSHDGLAMISLFSIIYGFFASGYSATWGGVVKEMESEARLHGEAVDTGLVYGLLNGGRGIGFLVGGFAGVELLKVGAVQDTSKWSYGTQYGSMILFTGLSAAIGGWSIFWRMGRILLK